MSTEPKPVMSQAPKTVRIGSEYVIKPSKFRIIIELSEGLAIDPFWQNDLDSALAQLATTIENATQAVAHDAFDLLPGEF